MHALRLARAAVGLLLLGAPRPVLAVAAGAPTATGVQWVARLLGLRDLVQAGVTTDRRRAGAGAAVDGLHAASMVALALRSHRHHHRRLALVSAAVAGTFALAGGLVSHQELLR